MYALLEARGLFVVRTLSYPSAREFLMVGVISYCHEGMKGESKQVFGVFVDKESM